MTDDTLQQLRDELRQQREADERRHQDLKDELERQRAAANPPTEAQLKAEANANMSRDYAKHAETRAAAKAAKDGEAA